MEKEFDRRKFYRLLKEKGEINKLKSHIRQKLILEYVSFNNSEGTDLKDSDSEQIKYYKRVANAFCFDHIKKCDYSYTLSVFFPECGITNEDIYNSLEMFQNLFLNIISSNAQNQVCRLDQQKKDRNISSLLMKVIKFLVEKCQKTLENNFTQTQFDTTDSYDKKLNCIDQEFEARRVWELSLSRKAVDNRLEQQKQEISNKYNQKLEEELTKFRQEELKRLKTEMEFQYQAKISEYKAKIDQDYQLRCNILIEKEKASQEKWTKDEQFRERELFEQRQNLQNELHSIEICKTKLNNDQKQLEKEKFRLQTENLQKEEELKKRENLLQIREQTLESEIYDRIERLRKEDQLKFVKQHKDLELITIQLQADRDAIEKDKQILQQMKQELIQQQSKFTEMEIADYDTIKSQNGSLKRENSCLKSQLEQSLLKIEQQNQTYASTIAELNSCSITKQEIDRLRTTLNYERNSFHQEKMLLQSQVDEQRADKQNLMERLALCEAELSRMRTWINHSETFANMNIHEITHSNIGIFTKANQNNKTLSEAERRIIYDECDISISSNSSLLASQKVHKNDQIKDVMITTTTFTPTITTTDMNAINLTNNYIINDTSHQKPIFHPNYWQKYVQTTQERIQNLSRITDEFNLICNKMKSDKSDMIDTHCTFLPNMHNINMDEIQMNKIFSEVDKSVSRDKEINHSIKDNILLRKEIVSKISNYPSENNPKDQIRFDEPEEVESKTHINNGEKKTATDSLQYLSELEDLHINDTADKESNHSVQLKSCVLDSETFCNNKIIKSNLETDNGNVLLTESLTNSIKSLNLEKHQQNQTNETMLLDNNSVKSLENNNKEKNFEKFDSINPPITNNELKPSFSNNLYDTKLTNEVEANSKKTDNIEYPLLLNTYQTDEQKNLKASVSQAETEYHCEVTHPIQINDEESLLTKYLQISMRSNLNSTEHLSDREESKMDQMNNASTNHNPNQLKRLWFDNQVGTDSSSEIDAGQIPRKHKDLESSSTKNDLNHDESLENSDYTW